MDINRRTALGLFGAAGAALALPGIASATSEKKAPARSPEKSVIVFEGEYIRTGEDSGVGYIGFYGGEANETMESLHRRMQVAGRAFRDPLPWQPRFPMEFDNVDKFCLSYQGGTSFMTVDKFRANNRHGHMSLSAFFHTGQWFVVSYEGGDKKVVQAPFRDYGLDEIFVYDAFTRKFRYCMQPKAGLYWYLAEFQINDFNADGAIRTSADRVARKMRQTDCMNHRAVTVMDDIGVTCNSWHVLVPSPTYVPEYDREAAFCKAMNA